MPNTICFHAFLKENFASLNLMYYYYYFYNYQYYYYFTSTKDKVGQHPSGFAKPPKCIISRCAFVCVRLAIQMPLQMHSVYLCYNIIPCTCI